MKILVVNLVKKNDKKYIWYKILRKKIKCSDFAIQDLAEEAGTSVTGGQTVLNPWLTIGGVGTTVCQPNEFIMWVVFWKHNQYQANQ